jgi:Domain of unknown function (DUF4365)
VARRKTVTPQTITGEMGINLIERRCLEMGYLFHPRRVDHGIDGHIDLVDPGSRALLNQVLLVQSKASGHPFLGETDQSFRYVCDDRDLDLWLSGNAPVILVLSHPGQDEAWWVEVKSAFPDAARRASRTVVISKHAQRFDAAAAPALLRRAVPEQSGLYLRPPPITEILTTNLLPVAAVPPVIYVATSAVSSYRSGGEALARHDGRRPEWILRDGMVMSFTSLRDAPLNALCDGDVEEHDTSGWARSSDIDITNRFIDLLTRTVQGSHPDLRWHNERRHVHFRPSRDLTPRKAGKGPGTRGRTVFGPHYAKSDPARVSYYHHAALRTRFRKIGGTWHCQLEPDYCFTSDGYAESPFADSLLAGIKRLDRHPAVFGWTRMWANYLTRPLDLFTPERPVTFGVLATVTVDRGIDDNWWGPAPAEALPEEDQEHSPAAQALVVTELAAADIDTDDLKALLTDPSDEPGQAATRQAQASRHPRHGVRRDGKKGDDSHAG